MDKDHTRTALRLEVDLTEEEKNKILKEKYSKNILQYAGKRRGRPPMTHRQYIVFYGKTKKLQKKIYARSVEEAVKIFKDKYKNYVPKFARDYWYKEVWADYTNENAREET
jgi:hypothetical protein